jgi:hypothetical protein
VVTCVATWQTDGATRVVGCHHGHWQVDRVAGWPAPVLDGYSLVVQCGGGRLTRQALTARLHDCIEVRLSAESPQGDSRNHCYLSLALSPESNKVNRSRGRRVARHPSECPVPHSSPPPFVPARRACL